MADNNEDELEYTHPLDAFYMDSGDADADQLSDVDQQCQLELEQALTSDSGNPPMGIMDDGSLSEYWRARPKKMVEEPDQKALQGRGNSSSKMLASASTHDGEKKPSSVAKRLGQQPGGLKFATTAAATPTAHHPVPRPVPKKPVVSPPYVDQNGSLTTSTTAWGLPSRGRPPP